MPEHFTLHADDILLPSPPRTESAAHAARRAELAAVRAACALTITAIDAALDRLAQQIAAAPGRPQ